MVWLRPAVAGLVTLVLCISVGLPLSASAHAQTTDTQAERAQAQQQLEAIQREIESRRSSVQRRQQRLSGVQQALKDIEQQVAQHSQVIAEINRELEQNQGHIDALEAEQSRLRESLQEQAQLLEDQIESAYRAGGHDFIQMLLNQQDPARIERIITYYRYFNDARMAQIEALHVTEQELVAIEHELSQQRANLEQRIARQQRQRDELAASQAEQQQLAERLAEEQRDDERQLTSMLQSEQELTELLAALETVLAQQDIQLAGLRHLRGELRWPSSGTVRNAFGQQRSGQVNWKGVVLNVSAEQPVQAIADGRVLFADWLRGFGLVMVIDHGEGYMSLYGYNQSLTRDVGEPVRRGETIAVTGQSGGQSRPGLYFEIRHQGNPVDPVLYIRR